MAALRPLRSTSYSSISDRVHQLDDVRRELNNIINGRSASFVNPFRKVNSSHSALQLHRRKFTRMIAKGSSNRSWMI
jgi:hypothetical protein